MPTSSPAPLTHICTRLLQWRGKIGSVLDVGIGNGKYGFLAREYLDVWGGRFRENRFVKRGKIDGIEAFRPYLTPLLEQIYDQIFGSFADLAAVRRDLVLRRAGAFYEV